MKTQSNLWPLGILAAFGLFFLGLAGVVLIAATHREDLVNGHYYEQELKFQEQIDAATRAQKSGANITRDAAADRVIITLAAAQPLGKCTGTVEFYRPSAPGLDRQLTLTPGADGTQSINVSQLADGPWVVRVKWNLGGEDYFLEQKIII